MNSSYKVTIWNCCITYSKASGPFFDRKFSKNWYRKIIFSCYVVMTSSFASTMISRNTSNALSQRRLALEKALTSLTM